MAKFRVLHYVNQFFAGAGGEDKADIAPGTVEGPAGPGKRLQQLLGESAEIVATAYCGDNYFAYNSEQALKSITEAARKYNVGLVIAGTAFNSGRYGVACMEVCHALSTSLGLDCVTAMYPENPGIEAYKQHKNRRIFALPTAKDVSGMEDALSRIAQFARKLIAGCAIGPAAEEGYIARGIRVVEPASKSGVERALDMLLSHHRGQTHATEIPIEIPAKTPIAPPVADLARAQLAIVSEAGIVPEGNPDGFKTHHNAKWGKYSVEHLSSMKEGRWEIRHGGWGSGFMMANPNFGMPLDVLREMEREGIFKRLFPCFYSTCGNNGAISDMRRIGGEIVADMKHEGIDCAILVAT